MSWVIGQPHHACDSLLPQTPLLATMCISVTCCPMSMRAEVLPGWSFPALQVPHGHSLEGPCNEDDILGFVGGGVFKPSLPFNNMNCLFKPEETVPFSHGEMSRSYLHC